jgi:hypothetical protein
MDVKVNLVGDGLAACCSARLLSRREFSLSLTQSSRPRPARLLVSEQTQQLLCEIFEAPHLFQDEPQIRRRIVQWGEGSKAVELPHRGAVVSEQELLDHLWQQVSVSDAAQASVPESDITWSILSVPGAGSLPEPQSFGSRVASTAQVELSQNASEDCCWVESLPDGWLFLLPAGEGRGTLISAGFAPEALIEQSTLIIRQISNVDVAAVAGRYFPVFPSILPELCCPGWLSCGSAAMTFDPLCGEGAGHAAREALLASAVISAIAKGNATEEMCSHYATRLMQGFLRHLQVCLPFYQSGGSGPFWRQETAALQLGIAWMQNRLQGHAPFRYRLAGYELELMEASR